MSAVISSGITKTAKNGIVNSKVDKLKQPIARDETIDNSNSKSYETVRKKLLSQPSSSSSLLSSSRDLSSHYKRKLADDKDQQQDGNSKRHKGNLSSISSSHSSSVKSSLPFSIPDPNAAPDRIKRKNKSAPMKTQPSSLSSSALSSSSSSSLSSSAAPSSSSFSISEDRAGEQLFYQTVLSWDPTDTATFHVADGRDNDDKHNDRSQHHILSNNTTFSDASAYQSFFRPLLFQDFYSQLVQSYETNINLRHLPSAYLSSLLLARCDERDGRGGSDDMFTAELWPEEQLDQTERIRLHIRLKEWMIGDLALLRYHRYNNNNNNNNNSQQQQIQQRNRSHHSHRYQDRHNHSSVLDCYTICLIDSLEFVKTSDPLASAYQIRVRVYLPGATSTASEASSSTTTPSRVRQNRFQKMWHALHPQATGISDTSSKQQSKPEALGFFSLIHLDSPITTLREFIALLHVDSLSLLPYLLHPSPSPSLRNMTDQCATSSSTSSLPSLSASLYSVESEQVEVDRSFSVLPEKFRHYLGSILNEYQLLSVRVAAYRCQQPGFTLLQGPPGTGKTQTVLALLNSLHLRSFQSHYASIIPSLLQRPALLSMNRGNSASQPITLDELVSDLSSGSKSTRAVIQPKPRLLVCAPSNAGVDEIISRVLGYHHRSNNDSVPFSGHGGFIDGNYNRYSPDIVRIGPSDHIRDEVKAKISLDVLVDSYMKLTVEQLQQRSRNAAQMKKKTENELNEAIRSYRIRYEAAVKERGMNNHDSSSSHNIPYNEVVEPSFLSGMAHLHERLHLASLDYNRCQAVLSVYESLTDQPGVLMMKPRERQTAIDRLRLSYLNEAHIVFSTLSGAGLESLSHLDQPFSALLIDEAAQATELATLVAMRHNVSHVVLIGDPRQLPATVFMNKEYTNRLDIERSLFERLQQAGQHVMALLTQYRMHAEIRAFPSTYFYEGLLQDGENITSSSYHRPYHQHPLFAPFLFFDAHIDSLTNHMDPTTLTAFKQQYPLDNKSRSPANIIEAAYIVRVIEMLLNLYGNSIHPTQIGIITFYQQQKKILEQMIQQLYQRRQQKASCQQQLARNDNNNNNNNDSSRDIIVIDGNDQNVSTTEPSAGFIEVSTVDGFQGREKEVILVSCVRHGRSPSSSSSSGLSSSIGFVSDIRRMNVALTRAKYAMWVFGDAHTLSRGSEGWRQLVQHAKNNQRLRRVREVRHIDQRFLPVLDITQQQQQDIQTIDLPALERPT